MPIETHMSTKDSKNAFEKIRSRVQRLEIYRSSLSQDKPFTIRINDDLFYLYPRSLDESNLVLTANDKMPLGLFQTMAFFQVDQDRFFLNGNLEVNLEAALLNIDTDLFKLERRKSLRAILPSSYPIKLLITAIQDKAVFIDGELIDVSVGGFRFYIPSDPMIGTLPTNTKIKGTLRSKEGKTLVVEGLIRHCLQSEVSGIPTNQFGVEIIQSQSVTVRMTLLTMAAQRHALLGY